MKNKLLDEHLIQKRKKDYDLWMKGVYFFLLGYFFVLYKCYEIIVTKNTWENMSESSKEFIRSELFSPVGVSSSIYTFGLFFMILGLTYNLTFMIKQGFRVELNYKNIFILINPAIIIIALCYLHQYHESIYYTYIQNIKNMY